MAAAPVVEEVVVEVSSSLTSNTGISNSNTGANTNSAAS